MSALAVATTIQVTMNNHFYTFGGSIHRQVEGSAIGSDLSGEIARNVMGTWDNKFLTNLKSLGIVIDLYSRYVDDQLEVCPPIQPGWIYNVNTKNMEYSQNKAEYDTDQPAVRTAKVLQTITNNIEPCIQLTYDTPDQNDSRQMPVLDLKFGLRITQ